MGTKTKIKDIDPKMRNIEVIARVTKKEFFPVTGKKLATLEDDTGLITLNLMGPQADHVTVGDSVKVKEAYVKMQGISMELNTWRSIEVQENDA